MELTNNLSEKALYDYKVVKRAITGDEQAYMPSYLKGIRIQYIL
ncbi:MAG: hypothetical protein ACLUDU_09445 [Butyricimonas faecihominis]